MPIHLRKKLKRFWQRQTLGWDDSDTWSLDSTITDFILPRLIRFKELNNGYPSAFDTPEEWDNELDKMIAAFKLMQEMQESMEVTFDEGAQALVQEGMESFCKNYNSLWW